MKKPVSVAFLVPYPPDRAPSQRFRVEMLLPLLDEAGIQYRMLPFMSDSTWRVLYQPGHLLRKAVGIVAGYFRRLGQLPAAARADYVFVHREASPLGPPIFEWLLSRVLRKRIIYDFDDAIWIGSTSNQNSIASRLKWPGKVAHICRWAYTVTGGNDYLCDYARAQGATNVVCIPTVVDTERRYNPQKSHSNESVIVGWTGSHSTLPYLDSLVPILQDLQRRHPFTFLVIADKKPALPLETWEFVRWQSVTEIADLLRIDIGVMPLTSDPWSAGKCGFKLIQYLALGIPAIASPVGVNTVIIQDKVNGYLAASPSAWISALETMLGNRNMRIRMGEEGRRRVQEHYSIHAITIDFLGLFEKPLKTAPSH